MKKIIIALLLLPFISQAQIISTIAGNGFPGYGGDGFSATSTIVELNHPADVAVDTSGNIYIADFVNYRIRKINTAGVISTFAGNGLIGFSGDGGAATAAKITVVEGIAIDDTGNVYIADQSNNRIRKINTLGIIRTIAGNGTGGYSGDGGAATAAELYKPMGIAIDAIGNLYIADANNNCIRKINTSGTISTLYYNATFNPLNLVVDIWGNTYVGDGVLNVVWKINAAGVKSLFAGNGTGGYSGDGGAATAAELYTPWGLAIDNNGNVYIADYSNFVIRKVNISGIISTYAGIDTTGGFSGDGGAATNAKLNVPTGISFDLSGNLYIADLGNNRIRKVSGISGSNNLCIGATTTLVAVNTGGSWSSSNTLIATVVATTGIVTGLTQGIATITYTVGSSIATATITVNPLPTAGTIIGASSVCAGSIISLVDTTPSGLWSSSNGHATVSGGAVTGISTGIDTIQYSVTNYCGTATTTKIITVNPLPNAGSITGASNVCVGLSITLTDGVTGGVWNSSNITATVLAGVVTGVTAGIDTIKYTVTSLGCIATATKTITINPLPNAGTITGASTVCVGSTIFLTDTITGGVWSCTNSRVALSGSIVTGVSAGLDTIIYTFTNSCGSATTTKIITINPLPVVSIITGASSICVTSSIILSDATTGGIWSSSNSCGIVTGGIVTGVSAGIDTIGYSVSNACGIATTTKAITINPLPTVSVITGASSVCSGAMITLSDATTGGIWSSSNGSATVTGGVVTGISTGTDTISYSVSNICGIVSGTKIITVNPSLSAGTILGASSVCAGLTITLANTITGGIWSSSNSSATVLGGVVTGVSSGIDTINYTVTNPCGTVSTMKIITVNVLPIAGVITGDSSVCLDSTIVLTATISGGKWSSLYSIANVDSIGEVTGISSGLDAIIYTVTNVCGSTSTIFPIIVLSGGACIPAEVKKVSNTATTIKVFPNPNEGVFSLLISSAIDEQVAVTITNIVGAKMTEFTVTTNKEIEVQNHLPKGIYTN